MSILQELAQAIIVLIRLGCICRFIYCMVRLSGADEEASKYKKRTRNVILFYVIAESIWQLKELMLYYYQ